MVLIAALLVLLNLSGRMPGRLKAALRELVAPVQQLIANGAGKIAESVQAVRSFGDLADQKRVLEAELVRLRNEVLTLQALEKENIDLRQQLMYADRSERTLVPSEVLARDVSGWWQTIRLGKGYLHGVRTDQAVITPEGLVGKVVDNSPTTADVLLISDPSCRVAVQITRTGTFGILSGRGPGVRSDARCRMDYLNRNVQIREGDEVVTSGLGGVFPQGLLVGYVGSVERDRFGMSQSAEVIVRADIGRLTHAFVVVEDPDRITEVLEQRARTRGPREVNAP